MPDDLPPLQWFLRLYGAADAKTDYTFEELGISGAAQELVNQGVDTCTLSFTGLNPAGAALLQPGQWATVFGGSLAWFSGRMPMDPQRRAAGSGESCAVKLLGPWHDLTRHVYMAPGAYVTNPPLANATGVVPTKAFAPVKGSAVSSNLLLAKDQDGTLVDGMQTLRRALAYSLLAGAWFQLGRLPATLPVPAEAIRDRTVADVIRAVVRWHPALAVFFDYRTLPPTLHIVARADLPPVRFASGDDGVVHNVDVWARNDLVVPGVCVQYIRPFTQTPQIQIVDTAGSQAVQVAPVQAKPTLDLTGTFVPANGPGINSGNSHFVPNTGPGMNFGTGLSFVPGPSPFSRPNAPTVYNTATGLIVQSSGGVTTAQPPGSGDPDPAAPTVPANSVAQAPAFTFYSIEYETAGEPFLATGETVLKLGAVALTVELNGGELNAAGYAPAALDKPPYGLATMIHGGRAVAPYEGTIELRAQDVGFGNFVGRAVNVDGGAAEWATMNALCQALSRNTTTGQTTLTLGPPTFLGASDLQSILKAARGFAVVGAGVALTDPALPPVHAPLPSGGGGGNGGNGGGTTGGEGDRPEDQALAPFLTGPGAVRGEYHVVNQGQGYHQLDGIDHGPVALGIPWFDPEVATADNPGLYYTLNLTAGYGFRDGGTSPLYDGFQTSDSRRSVATIELRGVQDPDATRRVELVGTNIGSRPTGINASKRVRVDITHLIGTRTLLACPEPPDLGQERKLGAPPPQFPYNTMQFGSVVFDKIAILDMARVSSGPPDPTGPAGDYDNPPGSGAA